MSRTETEGPKVPEPEPSEENAIVVTDGRETEPHPHRPGEDQLVREIVLRRADAGQVGAFGGSMDVGPMGSWAMGMTLQSIDGSTRPVWWCMQRAEGVADLWVWGLDGLGGHWVLPEDWTGKAPEAEGMSWLLISRR